MQPPGSPRRVTIIDVARHAQVSTTTVSKVLRNAYGASPAMRAKVQQAMVELGYRPYAAARGMRGQTYTIGVMLPDLRNPFFPDILDGLTDALNDTQYQVLVGAGGHNDEKAEARGSDAMIDHGMGQLPLGVASPSLQRSSPNRGSRPPAESGRRDPTVTLDIPIHLMGVRRRRRVSLVLQSAALASETPSGSMNTFRPSASVVLAAASANRSERLSNSIALKPRALGSTTGKRSASAHDRSSTIVRPARRKSSSSSPLRPSLAQPVRVKPKAS